MPYDIKFTDVSNFEKTVQEIKSKYTNKNTIGAVVIVAVNEFKEVINEFNRTKKELSLKEYISKKNKLSKTYDQYKELMFKNTKENEKDAIDKEAEYKVDDLENLRKRWREAKDGGLYQTNWILLIGLFLYMPPLRRDYIKEKALYKNGKIYIFGAQKNDKDFSTEVPKELEELVKKNFNNSLWISAGAMSKCLMRATKAIFGESITVNNFRHIWVQAYRDEPIDIIQNVASAMNHTLITHLKNYTGMKRKPDEDEEDEDEEIVKKIKKAHIRKRKTEEMVKDLDDNFIKKLKIN